MVTAFETCFHDRANAKDLSDVPASCAAADKAQADFAASNPDLAARVAPIVARYAEEASHRNFSAAMTRTPTLVANCDAIPADTITPAVKGRKARPAFNGP